MKDKSYEKRITEIARKVACVKQTVVENSEKVQKKLKGLGFGEGVEYIPTPFEIAEHYGIRCIFKKIEGDMPSYLSRRTGVGTIYISDIYRKESYEARLLCAHELGHYFLHSEPESAMNNDILNEFLPSEIMHEYEANVFSILLMPQIMSGQSWQDYSPRVLNRRIYKKALKIDR